VKQMGRELNNNPEQEKKDGIIKRRC
jgi:hypothetical protein